MQTLSDVAIFANAVGRVVNVSQYDLALSDGQHHHLRDALSTGQLLSKVRALKILLPYRVNRAVFIGHWHGMLPRLLHDFGVIKSGIGIELDPFWSDFSKRVNWDWDWNSVVSDAQNGISTWCADAQIVINTSCEHMDWRWLDTLPNHVNVLLQATDMPAVDHVTKITSIDQLCDRVAQCGRKVIHQDVLPLHADYSRYTVIAGSVHE